MASFIAKFFNKNYGIKLADIKSEDYLFGGFNGVPKEVLIPDKDWTSYLPSNELQKMQVQDTMACVSYSTLNCLEILLNYQIANNELNQQDINWLRDNDYLNEHNKVAGGFSDRFLAKMSDTSKSGNYLSKVGDSVRHHGLVPDNKWNFQLNFDWDKYYQEIPEEIKQIGLDFLNRFKINYEIVYASQFEEALKYSPIQVIVHAWKKNNNGIYIRNAETLNHAVTLFKPRHIFDHYDPFIKQLSNNYSYFNWGYKWTITPIINNKSMILKNNNLYLLTEGPEMKAGIAVDNKLLIDDWDKVQRVWLGRTKGDIRDRVISVGLADWNSVKPHYNLKMQEIK